MRDDTLLVFGGGLILLWSPLLAYFLIRYGVSGLIYASTLTELGPRTGLLARLWGLFYLLMFVFYSFAVCFLTPELLKLGLDKVVAILGTPHQMVETAAYTFIGMGLCFAIAGLFLVKFESRVTHSNASRDFGVRARQAYLYLSGLVLVAIGFFSLLRFPIWAHLVVLVLFSYMSFPLWLKFHSIARNQI